MQSADPKEKADSKKAVETAYEEAAETAHEEGEAVCDKEATPLEKTDGEKLVDVETVQSSVPPR